MTTGKTSSRDSQRDRDRDRNRAGDELCKAAAKGDIGGLRRCLEAGYDMNSRDYDHRTALHLAASEGHLEVVVFLLQVYRTACKHLTDGVNLSHVSGSSESVGLCLHINSLSCNS